MEIKYSGHLKRRLILRRIPEELPKIIFNEYDEKYFDNETGNFVLIKKVEFLNKALKVFRSHLSSNHTFITRTLNEFNKNKQMISKNNKDPIKSLGYFIFLEY